MKLSSTAIRELSAQYRSVLKKCFILNACVLMATAPAMAATGNPWLADEIAKATAGSTILVEESIDRATGIIIESGTDVSVDFQNNSYTFFAPSVGSTGTQTLGIQAKKNSTIVFENGTLNVAKEQGEGGKFLRIIQSYTDFSLKNMQIDATNLKQPSSDPYTIAVSHTNGTMLIENSTVTAKKGESALALYYWQGYYKDASMILDNSTINGDIELTTLDAKGNALNIAADGLKHTELNFRNKNTVNGDIKIKDNNSVNISGDLVLNGSIIGQYTDANSNTVKTGSVVFADNASLTAALKNSTIVANSVEFIGDNVVLNLTNIAAGTYDLIDASITGNFKLSDEVLNNAVFDITKDGYKITAQTKSAEDIADNLGVSEDTAQVIGALGQVAANNEKAQAALNIIANTDTPEKVREKIVENINPTSTPVVQSVATEVNGQIMNLVGARLAPATGRAGGDYKIEAVGA